MSDLALTLAQHPRFPRETSGILWIDPTGERDPIRVIEHGVLVRYADAAPIYRPGARNPVPFPTGRVPDLSDPATAGVLLAMLVQADPTMALTFSPRESACLVRITITRTDGRRWMSAGHNLGTVVAQALLLAWGSS